jgi:hypothetical protein
LAGYNLHIKGVWLAPFFTFIGVDRKVKGNEKKALEDLRKTLTDLEKHEGPWAEHPIFGKMTKEKWLQLTSLHIASHLGWAKLKTDKA